MAIVKVSGGPALDRRVGLKAAKESAKKSAKQAAEKHEAKKHAAKKHAEKHPGKKAAKKAAKRAGGSTSSKTPALEFAVKKADRDPELISKAFHHLQRASALISLMEPNTGGDLGLLLEHGIALYRASAASHRAGRSNDDEQMMRCAVGLLKAAEHLAMAGLYAAREDFRVGVEPAGADAVKRHLLELRPRLQELGEPEREQARRLHAMARELLRRADQTDGRDPHLDYELTMAADGLCTALENGL